MRRCSAVAVAVLLTSFVALGASFTPGNIVIYRVGDGSATLSTTSVPVFLEERNPDTGALVQTIAIPSAFNNYWLTATGSFSSEGLMTRSADGAFLMVTGYHAPAGTASVATTTVPSIPRAVMNVGADGTFGALSNITNAFSGVAIRSAASLDGWEFWATGGGSGVQYATLGATTTDTISTTVDVLRATAIFDGQLYVSSSQSSMPLDTVGTGVPTTAATMTVLPGYPTANAYPAQFFFADLDGRPGVDTLYVADDVLGIAKFSLVSGSWVSNGSIGSARGLTGIVTSAGVTLYFTDGNEATLQKMTDSSGYNATITGTIVTLATAPANMGFHGVAMAPATPPAPPASVSATATTSSAVSISWPAVSGAIGYDVFRTGAGSPATRVATVFTNSFVDTTVSTDSSYLYSIRAFEVTGLRSASSPVDLATTVIFHDDPLLAGTTIVQGVHVSDLRTAVNAVRALAGLAPAAFTDPSLGSNVTVKAVHIDELRSALDDARSALTLPALSYAETLTAGATTIKASHLTEIRNGVK